MYIISRMTGYARSEILSLTRDERIRMFERAKVDLEGEYEYRKALLTLISRLGGA
jgi:hypothetical protein